MKWFSRFFPVAIAGFLAGCAHPPPPMMSAYNPVSPVEICAGGECGLAGEKFALDDVAKAIGEMFRANGPGVWDFCVANRHDRRCVKSQLSYPVYGIITATGYVPGGALRAGARYDGKRAVRFGVNIPTIVFDTPSVCDDARSNLSVRSPNNILWQSNPYMCSWGGGPKNIKAEGRYGIDYIDFDRGVMGGEFIIRVSEGGNGYTEGYAVTKLSVGMQEVREVWLRPKGAVPRVIAQPSVPTVSQPPQVAAAPSKPPAASARFPQKSVDVSFRKGAPRPDDIAVIIGNADYAKHGNDVPDVVPAYADAAGFKRYVMQALGVREGNIIELRDATGAQMARVFGTPADHRGQLYDWVVPGVSRVWIYYAGHGAPAAREGTSYLVPIDADGSRIQLNGYALDTLYRNLGHLPAKSTSVVLEACFSGASQAGTVIDAASAIYARPREAKVPAGVTVIAAGAPDQIASWEKDKSQSLFTKYFLTGMSGEADKSPFGNGDGQVAHAELDAYLKRTMTYYARRYYGRDQTAQIVVGGVR
ncbi:MAG: caspase family protein [Rhodospirillales bacterium]|nr:caspase family protein [Rhodospirillales bacterium]